MPIIKPVVVTRDTPPYAPVTIRLQTREAYDIMHTIMSYNISIPDLISGGHSPYEDEVTAFMNEVHNALGNSS